MNKKDLTKEQLKKYNHYHRLAEKHFGLLDAPKYAYVLHHKDETLFETDLERYLEWRIEDLEVLPYGEHTRLHMLGNTNTKGMKHSHYNTKYKPWKLVDGKRVYYE